MVFNVLLALMVFDLVFRAPLLHASHDLAFARSGFVDEKSARVLVREPDKAQMPLSVSYRAAESSRWTTTGKIAAIGEDVDFTHPFTLSPLKSATKYEYTTSNGHNGTFTTAPKVGHPRLTFLTTSCLKPRVPYNVLHHPLQMPGLDALASLLPKLQASFMLFLGDFIYVDVPFRFGWQASNYRREYRQVYASPSWGPVSQNLPWLHVIDDHEIANDWDRGVRAPYPAAIDPFSIYHHSVNPPAAAKNETFYTFRHGPASFFLLDTRRHRTPSTPLAATHPNKTILGTQQRHALLSWLGQHEPGGVKWKILVSSVPLTRNWRTNAMDTWGGYLVERQLILESMWDAAAKGFGVVTVSGDRHEFAATRFPAPIDGEHSEPDKKAERSEKPSQRKPETKLKPNARSNWGRSSSSFSSSSSSSSASSASRRWQHPTTNRPVAVWEFSCSPLSMFYLPIHTYHERKGETSGVGLGGEDQMIAYVPVGNSKVGAVDIGLEKDERGRYQSVMRYRLFVDGRESWAYGVAVDGREGEDLGAGVVDS
jgi:alkaline phosphatase D